MNKVDNFVHSHIKCSAHIFVSECVIAVCDPPCLNGGYCYGPGLCACPEGTEGSRCEIGESLLIICDLTNDQLRFHCVYAVQSVACEENCVNGNCAGGRCTCNSGWTGTNCDQSIMTIMHLKNFCY